VACPGRGARPAISAPSNRTTGGEPARPRAVGWNGHGGVSVRCDFGPSGTIGRGRCMYEMQRPRPVSRRRPADFSASFAPLDHLPGPATLPVVRSPRSPAGLGLPRAGWPGNYPSPKALSFPKAKRLQAFPAPWLRAFFSPRDRGFPQGQATHVFPSPRWLRAFFSPHSSGFPLRQLTRSFPFAGWLGGFPPCRWRRALPWPEASELPIAGGPGFPPCRVARSFLFADGAGLLLARRPGFALCRVARGFPLTGGSGFPLRRLPSRW